MNARALVVLGGSTLSLLGCEQTSYRVGNNMGALGGSFSAGGGGVSGASAGAGSSTGGLAPSCDGPRQPGSAPLSRLTNSEIVNTIEALLGSSDLEKSLVTSEVGRYEETPGVEVSSETIERLHRLAHLRAEGLAGSPAKLQQLTGCDWRVNGETACKTALYEGFVTRAFRRPLTDADRADMDAVYQDGKALGGSYESGARAVIEVTLQSPELVYLVAEGSGRGDGELVSLTPYETASRVAYFLTGAPPDDDLWRAASGDLTDDAIAAHAQRLLGTPLNRQQLRRFFERHLGLDHLEPSETVAYSSELAELTRESAFLFVEDVTFESRGTFRSLMTSPVAFMNGKLAEFYGVSGVTGDALQRLALDATQRRGLLTQPAYLRASSPGDSTRPVLRGIEVLKSVLCVDFPSPPPSIPALPEPGNRPATTMRERLTSATDNGGCSACHALINPIGLAFENYDAYGRYRTLEEGAPIDPSGTLLQTDAAGPFANAIELIDRIAGSADAARCFQKHWLTEAYRRPLEDADRCELSRVESETASRGGRITDTLLAVARSANLKYRPKAE